LQKHYVSQKKGKVGTHSKSMDQLTTPVLTFVAVALVVGTLASARVRRPCQPGQDCVAEHNTSELGTIVLISAVAGGAAVGAWWMITAQVDARAEAALVQLQQGQSATAQIQTLRGAK
jgi:hypothetical protein